MLKLSKIILEIKAVSSLQKILEKGKYYDLKVWFAPDNDTYGEYYEPYPGTTAGEEGWYWSKDWRYKGLIDGKYVFTDSLSAFDDERKEFNSNDLTPKDIRPTKED